MDIKENAKATPSFDQHTPAFYLADWFSGGFRENELKMDSSVVLHTR
ncbi:hypothetical protein [Rufibacter sp. XAAS-G3-1]|nr:hypothetical protein [Rufibacter sp. XAAS-G3-1]